jgi:hypothetical protein
VNCQYLLIYWDRVSLGWLGWSQTPWLKQTSCLCLPSWGHRWAAPHRVVKMFWCLGLLGLQRPRTAQLGRLFNTSVLIPAPGLQVGGQEPAQWGPHGCLSPACRPPSVPFPPFPERDRDRGVGGEWKSTDPLLRAPPSRPPVPSRLPQGLSACHAPGPPAHGAGASQTPSP